MALDPQTFLDDPQYLGSYSAELWPATREHFLTFLASGRDTLLLAGGEGWGRSSLLNLLTLYTIASFVPDTLTPLDFVVVSENSFARQGELVELMERSPYFRSRVLSTGNRFAFLSEGEAKVPVALRVVNLAGARSAFAGRNLAGVVIEREDYGLIDEARDRIEARGIPGVKLLLSFPGPAPFTSARVQTIERTWWETRPAEKLSGKTFYVVLGHGFDPVICGTQGEAEAAFDAAFASSEPGYVKTLRVPVELRAEFERNLRSALRHTTGLRLL